MARPCPICIHDSRPAIEQAMLNGKPKSQVAKTFGFTYETKAGKILGDHKVISRHEAHMKGAVAAAMNDREVKSGLALVNRLERLEQEVDWVIERARKGTPVVVGDTALLDDDGKVMMTYDLRLLLAAVSQGRNNVALLADLSGAIPDGKDDEMAALRRRLDTPEGRRALAVLDALDAQEDAKVARAD